MEKKHSLVYKIIVIGEELTGKSTFIGTFLNIDCNWNLKYVNPKHLMPDFEIRLIESKIQWKGSKEFKAFYQSAAGFIILFSLCDRFSFTCLESWLEVFSELRISKMNKILIIGAKADLSDKRKVSFEEVQELLSKYNLKYFELSTKTALQVKFALDILINGIIFNSQIKTLKNTEQ